MTISRSVLSFAIVGLSAVSGAHAQAQEQADFYSGKTINMIIGSGEAGVYDLGGRLMARHLKKYIPGNPNIVPRNMPGASSVVATEYVYNVAAADGTTLASVQPTVVLNKSLDPAAKYQPGRFSWIGRIQPIVLVGVAWRDSGLKNLEDARAKTAIVSASGASGTSAIVPWALNHLAGTKFQVIRGYQSQRPQFLAMERGEVQGIGSASLSDVLANRGWIDNGRVSFLYTISQARSTLVPDTPAIVELASNDADRKVLSMLGSISDIGQTLMAPPGLEKAQETLLRKAFDEMVKDTDMIAEAAKIGIRVDPLPGERLAALVSSAGDAAPETVEKLRAVTRPQ